MQQWLTGYKLKNRPYEILQILGEGGFGITYKAKSLALDIPVVIKTPNSRLQRDKNYSKYLANFTKEAKQLAKLGMNPHPHIVRVFDFFEEDGLPCIVMDYIPGNSLYDMVQMNGALPEDRALEYIRQVGSALSVCHQQGIIHRDAHPNNILIHADSGKAILIDFGISGSTQTSRSNRSGNQAFAPWEQLISFGEESSKTPQVDIYTLAASFYYLVTGDTPTPSLARNFNKDELIEPKQYNSQLSDRINKALLKGMEIEISDRPQSVREWLELLKQPKPKPQPPVQPEYAEPPTKIVSPVKKKKKPSTIPVSSENTLPSQKTFVSEQSTESTDRDKTIIEKTQVDAIITKRKETISQSLTRRKWLKWIGLSGLGFLGINTVSYFLDNNQIIVQDKGGKTGSNDPELKEYNFDVITVNDRGKEINRERASARLFSEDLGDGILLDMVEIPGGTFLMGSPENELKRNENESPQHKVTVPSFYMAKFQVTQAQWKQIALLPQIDRELVLDISISQHDHYPLENVSWYDTVEFCKRLSKETGKKYRLPSEAEWEYACRAGTTTPFHFGNTITTDLVNYNGNYIYADEPKTTFFNKPLPVISFSNNAFGLKSMHGNVWEWCADSWHDSYQGAPNDGSAWITKQKKGTDLQKLVRGGSFVNYPSDCRSANRLRRSTSDVNGSFGFRCVAEI